MHSINLGGALAERSLHNRAEFFTEVRRIPIQAKSAGRRRKTATSRGKDAVTVGCAPKCVTSEVIYKKNTFFQ